MLTAFLAVAILAVVHLLVHRLRFLDDVPRSRWLSFAGGAAVAYVFLHLLPELAAHEEALAEVGAAGPLGQETVYVVALAGLVIFYALEVMVRRSPSHADGSRVHLASFALYNLLIGYLVLKGEERGPNELLLFAVAMGFHFLTTDYGLRQNHRERWLHWGRWVLAAAVCIGAALGYLTTLPQWAVSALFALLAGSVLLNVLKEELPEERQSRFVPFLAGSAGYAGLLIIL